MGFFQVRVSFGNLEYIHDDDLSVGCRSGIDKRQKMVSIDIRKITCQN